ncbi:protein of unknown function [Georgfuchsia toluolica]|uniref:Uncharacterized protein n=2 Tax=Georgfuchsia toluolica TaxID=424218 RepID=A0A916J619_9PROT|nr:protein of unknown function [Georgfuchsia toluolica]
MLGAADNSASSGFSQWLTVNARQELFSVDRPRSAARWFLIAKQWGYHLKQVG